MQLTHIDTSYNVRANIGRHLGQTVEPGIPPRPNAHFPGLQILGIQKSGLIGSPSNGAGIYPQKHMHHGAVGRHIHLGDLLWVNGGVPAHLRNHLIDRLHNGVFQLLDASLWMFILIGNPSQDIQPIGFLRIDLGCFGDFGSAHKVHQNRDHRRGADVNGHAITFGEHIPLKVREVSIRQDGMGSLLLHQLDFRVPQNFGQTGQTDACLDFFLGQMPFLGLGQL